MFPLQIINEDHTTTREHVEELLADLWAQNFFSLENPEYFYSIEFLLFQGQKNLTPLAPINGVNSVYEFQILFKSSTAFHVSFACIHFSPKSTWIVGIKCP